jgi:3-dehydroquinate synthase
MERHTQPANSNVFLGPLSETFSTWFAHQRYSQVFVIVDEHTAAFCLPIFLAIIGKATPPVVTQVPAGETYKNLASCEKIWLSMLNANLDRNALVVNLGGGVISDMGGFCAATWKRGVDFVHIPTTLLAMTDAAIGGKLGVDFHGIKNILGVFKPPTAVFADPVFLETLPLRTLRSGFAEIIKHALIGNPELWNLIPKNWPFSKYSPDQWIQLLHASIAVKLRIVAEDPLETGPRMLLNFGHTFGHALESYFLDGPDPITHGEAVAMGMICESMLSGKHDEMATRIAAVFPHRPIPTTAFPAIWKLMLQDKKNSSGNVRMALPDELPFSMKIVNLTPENMARSLSFYNGLY